MRSSIHSLGHRLWSVALLCVAPMAGAQQAPLPEDMAKGNKRPPQVQPPAPPASAVETPHEAPPVGAGGKTVTVNHFEFAGNTLYDNDTLEAQVKEYENRPVTLLELYEAADKVGTFYAENGYTLASVNLPPQKIENGTVRLLVSEGRIEQVSAEGNDSYSTAELAGFLGTVKPGEVYRGRDLEGRMRVLNTLPGLSARAVIKPGEAYGTSDLVLKVTEDRASGALIVDNHGRENIGQFRFSAFTEWNNPLGVADQVQLLGLTSENGLLNYVYGAYSVPVDLDGTRLTASYGYASFSVLGAPVDGKNRTGKVEIDHPVWRDLGNALDVSIGASRTRSNADIIGITFNGTALTLLELGASYNHTYSDLAVTQITTSIGTNFDHMERADLLGTGTIDADQRFRWELDVQHLQPIGGNLQLFAHVNGVYSPDPLADTQAFSLGGPDSVRGYPASEVRGDRGYFASLGLRRPFTLGPVSMSGRIFADTGKAYVIDPPPGVTKEETLTSVGIGTDAQYQRMTLRLDWSTPRDNHPASDGRDNSRVFGSLSVSF